MEIAPMPNIVMPPAAAAMPAVDMVLPGADMAAPAVADFMQPAPIEVAVPAAPAVPAVPVAAMARPHVNIPVRVTEPISNLRFTVGVKAGLDEMAKLAQQADQSLTGEIFVFKEKAVRKAVLDTLDGGSQGTFLIDPEYGEKFSQQTGGNVERRITQATYGEFPYKNHAKSFVGNHVQGLITTAAINEGSYNRWDITATFDGPAAEALEELTKAGVADDVERSRTAAREAAKFGIVLNDPKAGVRTLTDAVYGMIDDAQESLVIATKRYESPELMAKVDAARARGVKVDHVKSPYGFHANMIIKDGNEAYFGTAHLTKRSLTSSGSAGRLSRELGMIVTDRMCVQAVSDALDAVRTDKPGIAIKLPMAAGGGVHVSGKVLAAGGITAVAALGGLLLLSQQK